MIMQNSTYRKERYLYKTSQKKGRFNLFFSCIILLLLIVTIFISWKKVNELQAQVEDSSMIIGLYEEELVVLRSINPYQGDSNELVQTAINNSDVFPGWVTRVYPLPSSRDTLNQQRDFGSFVMNGTQFTLASHQMHGIEQPTKSMYRLSGLLPSYIKGRHQIGVKFNFLNDTQGSINKATKIGSCFAQLAVNHKRVIDKRVSMASRFETSRVVTGEVELGKGLFPIDAIIYCDDKSDFNDKDVEISFSFRNPSQQRLTRTSNSIFHIYSSKLLSSL
jgi:hypothetical protein